MKLSITKEQWDELSKEKQYCLIKSFGWEKYPGRSYAYWEFTNIGQMIEFLGDVEIIKKESLTQVRYDDMVFNEKELTDALWEAVKYKLNI